MCCNCKYYVFMIKKFRSRVWDFNKDLINFLSEKNLTDFRNQKSNQRR